MERTVPDSKEENYKLQQDPCKAHQSVIMGALQPKSGKS